MGCKLSCCRTPATPRVAPKRRLKRDKRHTSIGLDRPIDFVTVQEVDGIVPQLEGNLLQHISEREPDDLDYDPSTNPRTGPLFMQRSKSDTRQIRDKRQSQLNLLEARSLKKSSSCSTIFLDDSTVSHPNLKNTIKCVSLAIYYHIGNRDHLAFSTKVYEIFDERLHPLTKDIRECDFRPPDHKAIYRFMRTLFNAVQLPPECAIITLVYIERLLTYAETDVDTFTWKRIVLGAILLASKVWDDQAVWNVDYCQILRDITVEDMNELERQFLELLQFNINVPQSVYAKYYFDLRTLADQSDISSLLQPLSKERAINMEAMSKQSDEKPIYSLHLKWRKWKSQECIPPLKQSQAILS